MLECKKKYRFEENGVLWDRNKWQYDIACKRRDVTRGWKNKKKVKKNDSVFFLSSPFDEEQGETPAVDFSLLSSLVVVPSCVPLKESSALLSMLPSARKSTYQLPSGFNLASFPPPPHQRLNSIPRTKINHVWRTSERKKKNIFQIITRII